MFYGILEDQYQRSIKSNTLCIGLKGDGERPVFHAIEVELLFEFSDIRDTKSLDTFKISGVELLQFLQQFNGIVLVDNSTDEDISDLMEIGNKYFNIVSAAVPTIDYFGFMIFQLVKKWVDASDANITLIEVIINKK